MTSNDGTTVQAARSAVVESPQEAAELVDWISDRIGDVEEGDFEEGLRVDVTISFRKPVGVFD